jgi:hypothetical protein
MTSPSPLERLAGPGNVLAKEPPDATEFAGLVRSGLPMRYHAAIQRLTSDQNAARSRIVSDLQMSSDHLRRFGRDSPTEGHERPMPEHLRLAQAPTSSGPGALPSAPQHNEEKLPPWEKSRGKVARSEGPLRSLESTASTVESNQAAENCERQFHHLS